VRDTVGRALDLHRAAAGRQATAGIQRRCGHGGQRDEHEAAMKTKHLDRGHGRVSFLLGLKKRPLKNGAMAASSRQWEGAVGLAFFFAAPV